jgi:glycosyltransferase involved in cell wall biosynthesis
MTTTKSKSVILVFGDLTTGRQYTELIKLLLEERQRIIVVYVGQQDANFYLDLRQLLIFYKFDLYCKPSRLSCLLTIIFSLRQKPYSFFVSGWSTAKLFIPLAKLFNVKKIVYVRHHGNIHYLRSTKLLSRMKGLFFDALLQLIATNIVAVSLNHANLILSETCNKSKIFVIPNSYENSLALRSKQIATYQERLTEGLPYTIGIVARITDWKGVHIAVQAISELSKNYKNLALALVGKRLDSWDEVHKLLLESPHLDWKHFEYLGDMRNFYDSVHCIVHTPLGKDTESFGLVYVESMLSSLPLVATLSGVLIDNANFDEFIYVVKDYNDSNSVYLALEELLTSDSPKILSPAAKIELEIKYSLTRICSLYRDLLV